MTTVQTTREAIPTWRWMESPFGRVLLVAGGEGLREIRFVRGDREVRPDPAWQADSGRLSEAVEQLDAYFAGRRRDFALALSPRGTPFQRQVWDAVRRIPYGETRTYGEIAAAIGRPAAVRAVGAANGANPLPVVVPCHRVIGSGGKLTGYGGGLDMKADLLAHERGTRRLL